MRKLLVVLGLPIDSLTLDEALDRCEEFIAAGRTTGRTHQIATVNTHFVVNALQDPELRRILQEADMTTADGMPLVWASRLLGAPLPGRVTGADMVPALAARAARRGYSIYFLGAREGVAARAAAILQRRYPGLKVAGVHSPPLTTLLEMDRTIVERVRDARPDILLVAFGNPKQEKWIRMHAPELRVPVCIGVGATLDFIVGVTKRAPLWMQRSGLEWAYRVMQEPRRLFKRYLRDFFHFGVSFARQWWLMGPLAVANDAPARPVADIAADGGEPATNGAGMPVIHIRGRLTATSSPALLREARGVLQRSASLVLNLADTEFVDSAGIGALVAVAHQARASGGTLYLKDVPAPVNRLLALLKLTTVFALLPDAMADATGHPAPEWSGDVQQAPNGWLVVRAPRTFDERTAPRLLEWCQTRLIEAPCLVVDLSETVFVSSAAMVTLIRLDRMARERGGDLCVVGGYGEVLQTLRLAQVDRLLRFSDTLDEALATPARYARALGGDAVLTTERERAS
ncbi:MAG: WecB/TagA/CpsF family glycosyltransferase [Chloroflexaceae bacterium]|nr:WecB/TagA/CpsF family glycosyltransferase [Chloroflexaceae bacterium]